MKNARENFPRAVSLLEKTYEKTLFGSGEGCRHPRRARRIQNPAVVRQRRVFVRLSSALFRRRRAKAFKHAVASPPQKCGARKSRRRDVHGAGGSFARQNFIYFPCGRALGSGQMV